MKVSKRKCDLEGKELDVSLLEVLHLDEMAEQLPTFDKLHQEVNSPFVLKHILHIN